MAIEKLALIGSGGHAKVVLDALRCAYPRLSVEVFDEAAANAGAELGGIRIQLLRTPLSELPPFAHIAIGDAAPRERIGALIAALGRSLMKVMHPAASVA